MNLEDLENNKLNMVSVRLVKEAPLMSEKPINHAMDAVELVGETLCELDREVICIINLNAQELVKSSILSNAANMIMIHNHPTGGLEPSNEDTWITDRMQKVCNLIGIPLLDHVIVGGDNKTYFSFKSKDIMPYAEEHYENDYNRLELSLGIVTEEAKEQEPGGRKRHRAR